MNCFHVGEERKNKKKRMKETLSHPSICNYSGPIMFEGLNLNHFSPLGGNAFQLPAHVFIIDPVVNQCKDSNIDQS